MRERLLRGAVLVLILWGTTIVEAQDSPPEHARHHPGGGPPAVTDASGGGTGGMEGMGGMMDQMIKQMGAPPPKEIYPALMTLPGLRGVSSRKMPLTGKRCHLGLRRLCRIPAGPLS